MRNQRLLILGLLIAAVLLWLYFVVPGTPPQPPVRAAAAVIDVPAAATPVPAPPPAVPEPPKAEPVATPAPAKPAAPASEPDMVEETAPVEEPPATPAADPDKAADLFADQLAKQESEPEEGRLPNPARDLWKRFEKEQKDDSWSGAATDHLQDALDAWIDDLPEDMGGHVALVHVECRATLCQILAGDNDLNGQSDRAESSQEWQQAIAGLREQPWWSETGFSDMTTQVTSSDGYTLYTTYILRTAPPPPPQ
ncbi:MAG TPA: hypothetical protein VGC55_00670 [Dokdonella sp.]